MYPASRPYPPLRNLTSAVRGASYQKQLSIVRLILKIGKAPLTPPRRRQDGVHKRLGRPQTTTPPQGNARVAIRTLVAHLLRWVGCWLSPSLPVSQSPSPLVSLLATLLNNL